MAKSFVVTGGAGAIGSRLVARLLRDPGTERVVVIDDLSSGHHALLPSDPRVDFRPLHVEEEIAYDGIPRGAIVFHLAAHFANQNSVDHPADDLRTNGLGTLRVLEWARRSNAERVVFASAGCTIVGHDVQGPIREDMPPTLDVATPYQATKMLGELYCNYFHGSGGPPTVRCRFFNSYGPGEVPGPYRNVIPNFFARALEDQPLVITGTGFETRDFLYVDDLVEGLVLSATDPRALGEAVNLGTGRQTRILDIARFILEITGSKSPITFAPRRSWDRTLTREACIDKARALGFHPQTGIREGLTHTLQWFLDYPTLTKTSWPERAPTS